jgi:hypothetical protein
MPQGRMDIAITKGQGADTIAVHRRDGSSATARVPQKGPVPHDAVHFFAERELGLGMGFWGMVALGHDPDDLAELAKAAGHASASRAQSPDPDIVELIQSERIVESFEADLWSGSASDVATLAEMVRCGCETSLVAMPDFVTQAVLRVQQSLADFARTWIAAPVGHKAQFQWEESD